MRWLTVQSDGVTCGSQGVRGSGVGFSVCHGVKWWQTEDFGLESFYIYFFSFFSSFLLFGGVFRIVFIFFPHPTLNHVLNIYHRDQFSSAVSLLHKPIIMQLLSAIFVLQTRGHGATSQNLHFFLRLN